MFLKNQNLLLVEGNSRKSVIYITKINETDSLVIEDPRNPTKHLTVKTNLLHNILKFQR